MARPSTPRAPKILRSFSLLIAGACAVAGCSSSCGEKKEPTVIIIEAGADQPRLKRPFDLRRPDSGVPLFRPRTSASSDASDAVIE